jgi:hypothetical protein
MGTTLNFEPIENADDLLGVQGPEPELVQIPEWNRAVYVRGVTGTERDSWEASNSIRRPDGKVDPNPVGTRARLIVRGICNAQGERLFTDKDWPKVGGLDGAGLERLFDKIAQRSGMTAEAVEDAEGNSESDPSDGSTSD